MDKDYTTYSADQLLNDDFFIQSELHPTEKSRAFWSDLQINLKSATPFPKCYLQEKWTFDS